MAIGHRGKLRERYRNAADEMERVAKFLRKPHPYGMPAESDATRTRIPKEGGQQSDDCGQQISTA